MALQGKLSFRKQLAQTGLAGVGNPWPNTTIKIGGLYVGEIVGPNWQTHDGKWCVRLMRVAKEEAHCGWCWVQFKARFDTEPEAREWLKKSLPKIEEKFTLRQDDDEDLT